MRWLFDTLFIISHYFSHLCRSITVDIQAFGKGDYKTLKAYRLIALLSQLCTVLKGILGKWLSHLAKTQLFFPDTQSKNWQTRSIRTEAQALIKCMYKAWNIRKIKTALLSNLPGSFDIMFHVKLIHNLKHVRYQKL